MAKYTVVLKCSYEVEAKSENEAMIRACEKARGRRLPGPAPKLSSAERIEIIHRKTFAELKKEYGTASN